MHPSRSSLHLCRRAGGAALALALWPLAAPAAELTFPGMAGDVVVDLPALPAPPTGEIDLARVRDRAFAVADLFPAAEHDLDLLAESLGGDPAAAFAFVRDRIGLDPYDGALRGAEGTLAAGAGGSADRALLLASLLQAQGVAVRFAVGTLDPAGTERVHAAALNGGIAGRLDAEAQAAVVSLAGLSPAALDRLDARARRDLGWLWPAVGAHLGDPSAALAALPARHVWVQAMIDGAWTDLDPTLPDAAPGTALAAPEATYDALPDDMWHRVTVAVVAESLADGALVEQTLLAVPLAAADAAAGQVFLVFSPAVGGGVSGLAGGLMGAMGEAPSYVPTLVRGELVESGEPVPALPAAQDDAQAFFFGDEAETGPELTALYVDVTVAVPGLPAETRRRVLLDRVAPDVRQGGSVDAAWLAETHMGLDGPRIFETIHQIAVSVGGADPYRTAVGMGLAVAALGDGMASEQAMGELSLPAMLWPVGALNQATVLASERLSVAAANDRADLRLFVGAPRVFLFSFAPVPVGDGVGAGLAIDLLHDSVAAVAAEGVAPIDVAQRRLWYGVVQSALETTLAELRSGGSAPDATTVASTSNAMSPDLAAIAPADAAAVAADAPAALRDALADGDVVVVADGGTTASTQTWWTLDPASGDIRAVLDPGLGGATGGGWRPGGPYVNASPGGDRIIVDPRTGRNIGISRGGRDYMFRNRPPADTCRGGPEYQIILGCVSIPASMAVGTAYALIVSEIVLFAALTILQL
ncbi:MAG: transglutaminase domain-containing protein [Alphaproteobacteria bacterium]